MVHRQRRAVQPAPGDEGPVGAVPQPAQQHGDDDVRRLAQRAAAVAAERDVEVVAQEARQRHVPAPPEIADRHRAVRRVEVERQAQPEHQRQADRHVGVAGEIEVDLQRVGAGGDPRLGRGQRRGGGLARTADRPTIASVSASATFFATPITNSTKPRDRFSHISGRRGSSAELVDDLVVPHDRPGDELREERHEHAEVEEAVDVPVAAPQVDQVGDLLEHEEADAQRQDQVPRLEQLSPSSAYGGAAEEVGVFEQRRARRGSAPRRAPGSTAPRARRTSCAISQLATVSPASSGTKRTSHQP